MWDIVIDTNNVVFDYGTIERVNKDGEINLIKITRPDGYIWYVGTSDRDLWEIVKDVLDIPEDFTQGKYLYVDGEWILNPDWTDPTIDPEI